MAEPLIIAGKAAPQRDAVEARVALAVGSAPDWIMWMPGGTHEITARRRGKPVTVRVTVDPGSAAAAQRSLGEYIAASRQRPFFDFDHSGGAASGWPVEFAWRERPEPGVYARVDWSQAGRDAIAGRTYRAFSPTFFTTETDPARIDGCPLNCGGLVNDPAFRDIAPIWARHAAAASDNDSNNNDGMDELTAKTEMAALQARITELETANAELKAKADEAEAAAAIEAKDAEIAELRRKNDDLATEAKARRERDADAMVASAVSRGAIAAQDAATQKKWRDLVIADPANADLLGKLPGRVAVTAGRITQPREPIQIIKSDSNDCIRAYHAAATPTEKGHIYRREFRDILEKGDRIPFERFPVEATNVLGTVAGNLIAQRVLDLMVSRRPLLANIVTDFSSEQARLSQTVYTRTVGIPTIQNFGSGSFDTADTDYPVQLANHKEGHYAFTAAEYLSTNRNLVEEHAQALAVGLGNHMVDAVAALITDAFTSETTGAASGKDFTAVAAAAKALNTAGAPEMNRAMWVNSDFAEALSNDELIMEYLDGDNRSAYGHWTNIKGFAHIWEFPALPANAVNLIGFAFQRNALLLATRVADNPERLVGAGYAGSLQVVTDPVTGLSVLSDRWITQATRVVNTRLDVLYGCARGVVTAGHKFVSS